LEGAVVELFGRLDAVVPATHKASTRNAGSSATETPWTILYRAGCGLVVAAVALGDHYRRAARIEQAGPIRETLGDDGLQRIRQQAATGGASANAEETQQLHAALRNVAGKLPDRAAIQSEVEWVAANLHDPCPALDKAPSRTAVSLLLDAKRDERVRREFWTILLTKRLAPGEPKHRPTTFAEDQTDDDEQQETERMRRLFGDTA
jgi:plasmid stability protein